jgi:hypothetical protein
VYPGDLLCILVTPQLACQGGACPCGGIHQGIACPSQPAPLADDYLRPLRPARTTATPPPKGQGSTLKLVSAGWMRGAGFSRHIRLSPMALASGGAIATTLTVVCPSGQSSEQLRSQVAWDTCNVGSTRCRSIASPRLSLSAPGSGRLRDRSRRRRGAGSSRLQALALVFRPGQHRRYLDQGGNHHRPAPAQFSAGRAR